MIFYSWKLSTLDNIVRWAISSNFISRVFLRCVTISAREYTVHIVVWIRIRMDRH
jgi:hypothetical protein